MTIYDLHDTRESRREEERTERELEWGYSGVER